MSNCYSTSYFLPYITFPCFFSSFDIYPYGSKSFLGTLSSLSSQSSLLTHWKHLPYWLLLYFCLQGHSTLQASQDSSTLLTWMAGMNSPKTANAAATTPRKSKGRIASQVKNGWQDRERVNGLCRNVLGPRGVNESKPCSVFCCLSVLIGLCLPP